MGYTKLTYDNYMADIEYWLSLGIDVPLFAEQLNTEGFKSVNALDFYDSIFGEDLEEHRIPEDYQSGEYGAIAVERICYTANGKQLVKGRRTTVTRGNVELYDLIDSTDNFIMIAPISYAGRSRSNSNARFMYALVIEIDNIVADSGIRELVYSWNRQNQPLPKPTYIVCSGTGVHLYYVFERPIPLFKNIFENLATAKRYWTRQFWNKYVTTAYRPHEIQYESINQPFRCVGSRTKKNSYVMAFEVGSKVTIEYMNYFLPEEMKISEVYKSNLTLEQAKKQYPNWYQKRIIEKAEKGHWTRHEGIYYDWINKVENGAAVGHRYNCLENLCSLAVQCNIAPEQVEKDCRELANYLESLTVDESNHFTEYDILCALRTYHEANEGAYRRRIEYISLKTGIELKPNKRNGRKRANHIKYMNLQKEFKHELGECSLGGAKTKEQQVRMFQFCFPNGTKAECIRFTGLSKPTVYKWWNSKEKDN